MAHVHQLVQREGNNTPNPKPQKVVTVSCSWLNIFSVDTVEQTFEVDLVVRLRWREPATERVLNHFTELRAADGKQYNITKRDFIENCWNPQFQFPNCRALDNSEEWVRMERQGEDIDVCWTIRFHATKFTSVFDLRRFPFDQQALVIRICSTWDEKVVQFRAQGPDACRQAYDDYNLQDYELTLGRLVDVESKDPRDSCYMTRSDSSSSTSGARYNSIFLLQHVARHSGFFLLNFYLPTFLIASCCFIAYAIVVEEFGSRASILVTLMLTVVAFKQVIGQYLPRLPYITYMDRYALAGLSLVVVIGIIHASLAAASLCVDKPTRKPMLCTTVGTVFTSRSAVDHADYICLVVSSISWAVYQIFEVFMICRARRDFSTVRRDVQLPPEQELATSAKLENKEPVA